MIIRCRVCGWKHTHVEQELISKTGLKTYLIAADNTTTLEELKGYVVLENGRMTHYIDGGERSVEGMIHQCRFPREDFSGHITLCHKCGWKMGLDEPVYKVFYSRTTKHYHLCCYEMKK